MEELFGGSITPACRYCGFAYPTGEGEQSLLCAKRGVVAADHSCRSFRYDPLMRVPRRPLELEKFKAEDFAL